MIKIYSYNDYLLEEANINNKLFQRITYLFQPVANKSHFCEECGVEIHKNESYYIYKPLPTYNKLTKKKIYHKWRKRCIDHKPKFEGEIDKIDSLYKM